MKLLSIVVPTVAGREDHLERALRTYREHSRSKVELIVIHDEPTCGRAWNVGAEKATGDYLHLGADDVEPHDGWDAYAIEAVEKGAVPSAVYYNPDGALCWANGPTSELPPDWTPGVDHMRGDGSWYAGSYAPFFSAEQHERIGPTIDGHYGTDDFLSFRAVKLGYPIVVRTGFAFTHYHAMAGRGAGMEELERHLYDTAILNAAIAADADAV